MTGVNNILDCLDLNTPSNRHDISVLIRNQNQSNQDNSSSSQMNYLIIDVDTTLERLYGGFYPDWLAGGEWSHLYSYILSLVKTCQELSVCLVFCFDGTLYRYGQSQWYYEQIQQRKKVNQIFKHLKQNKCGLPRRHLWLPPASFQLCLRTIIRELKSPYLIMYQTWGYGQCQHQQQIKSYAQIYKENLIGIVSSDIEFLFLKTSNNNNVVLKYFSSKHFKLSLKGKLTLVQIQLNQLKDKFLFDNQQFSLLLSLLGNHILSESDLLYFHNELNREPDVLKRNLPKTNDANIEKNVDTSTSESKTDQCSPTNPTFDMNEDHQQISPKQVLNQSRSNGQNNVSTNAIVDQLIPRLVDFIEKQNIQSQIDFDQLANQIFKHITDDEIRQAKKQLLIESYEYYLKSIIDNQLDNSDSIEKEISTFSSSQTSINKSDENIIFENNSISNIEILRTAFNLHKQGLMMPWIFQCLYKREITFSVSIEPEMCNTIPNICEFYRPIRKYIYSLLFEPNTIIGEQVYNSEHGSYLTEVVCEQISTKKTIEQLWFGTSPDEDRQIRLKTFLQSLHHCDLTKFHSVSHEYILFICILRYMYMEFSHYSPTSILHTYELLAFICQAVLINELQPKPLMNLQSTNVLNQYDHIQITNYETRPVQLGNLFMRGYETIMFANEVCGAPIHPKYCCPSHFFNGKLFHQKYVQAQYYQQNQDLTMILCDGNNHYAQIGLHLLDLIVDRNKNDNVHHTPIQKQYQYNNEGLQQQQQQQRVLKYQTRENREQKLLANSTRPQMRTNNKQFKSTGFNDNHQQTPIGNYRQQNPPPVKQMVHARNGSAKKNHMTTPLNAKVHQQQTNKFNTHSPTNMNFSTPSHQQSLPSEQWTSQLTPAVPLNHLTMQTQHQQVHPINTIQTIPIQHQPPMNANFVSSLDDQFIQLQIHPPNVMTASTPVSYGHPTPMLNPQISIGSYHHIPPPLPPSSYPIPPNVPGFYQPSPPSAAHFQQPIATPYHQHHPQMVPGLPPHAPIAPQRTVNFTTIVHTNNHNNVNTFQQPSQRLSPNSMQAQETNLQALQQHIIESHKHQQTPLSIQRQMHRMPSADYTQYDIHRLAHNNGFPFGIQSGHHPSMINEQQQHLHGL